MSYFCQFCDKELVFEQSVVYERDYITCGAAACVAKAREISDSIAAECELKSARLLIFKSATPEDVSTWRIVAKKDYPDFLRDEEVLRGLFDGCVVGLQPDEGTRAEMYYCARKTEEVLRHMDALKEGGP